MSIQLSPFLSQNVGELFGSFVIPSSAFRTEAITNLPLQFVQAANFRTLKVADTWRKTISAKVFSEKSPNADAQELS